MKTFREKVRDVVKGIPKGNVMTYGDVAKKAGAPGAARAVGSIMAANYDPEVPCHRVVPANANLSGDPKKIKVGNYNRGGAQKKIALLREEGAIS